jgi:hypothetical protein
VLPCSAVPPESYARLIELCVRHEYFEAYDMAAASDSLQGICSTPAQTTALLTAPAAAAAAATALASVVKRAVGFLKEAGAAHAANAAVPEGSSYQLAVHCFPAGVLVLSQIFGHLAESLCEVAPSWDIQQPQQQQQHTATAKGSYGGSSMNSSDTAMPHASTISSSSQGRASAALLAVLLARSAVVLADAVDAAAAAAGITTAELLTRYVNCCHMLHIVANMTAKSFTCAADE